MADFSGIIKLKSVDKEFVFAVSAFKGNCIIAIFKDKQIIDRFSIPVYMRYIIKKYLKKMIESKETTLRFPIIKTKFVDGKFAPEIKLVLHKNDKYQYKPYYMEIIHEDINLHMNFPLIISSGISINEERFLPLPSEMSVYYLLDFMETQLDIAIYLSKPNEAFSGGSNSSQNSKGFTSL